MDEPSSQDCPGCRKLAERVAQLEALVEKLQAALDRTQRALEEAQRSGKRQAAPFRKKKQAGSPKKPGRKSGDEHGNHAHRTIPKPDEIDERYDVPLPEACPHCGGRHLTEHGVRQQYQTEIPRRPIVRQFDIHCGGCDECGKAVQGRHELQTSGALGAAASQLGPDLHAALAICNKELGLSHGKARTLDLKSRVRRRSADNFSWRTSCCRRTAKSAVTCAVRRGWCATKPAGASRETTPGCTTS